MNRNYKLLFVLIFLISTVSYAQQISIKISNAPKKAILLELQGEKTIEIDSVISQTGVFRFSLNDKHKGFYRLHFAHRHRIDFLNDGKDIEIKTDYNNLRDSLKVIKSESNKLYYEFIKLNKEYKTKTGLFNVILQRYPKDDNYYETTLKKLKQLQSSYLKFTNETSQKRQNSFIARYIRSAQLPVVDGTLPFEEQLKYLKSHSLDKVDFSDDELIYSDVFTNKSIEYLTYYRNPQLPKALLEKEFMTAVDTLLTKAKVNKLVYQQITEYLIKGFTKFGFDKIINYIVDDYVIKDNICIDVKLESTLQKRINQSTYFKIGNPVPNIILPDNNGKKIELSKIKAEKTLVLFYASWCPHCQEIVPKINQLYKDQKVKHTEVLAISIDTSKQDWINFVKTNKLNWINVSDLKGWFGKTAKDYFIYATPTMFLLNKDKRIIAKPSTIEELKKIL